MTHGAKLLKPLQTDLAACNQTRPHNDKRLRPYFLSRQEEVGIEREKELDTHCLETLALVLIES